MHGTVAAMPDRETPYIGGDGCGDREQKQTNTERMDALIDALIQDVESGGS